MCKKGECCQKPAKLSGKPQDCTPEQIKDCLGDVKKHPCTPRKKRNERCDRR